MAKKLKASQIILTALLTVVECSTKEKRPPPTTPEVFVDSTTISYTLPSVTPTTTEPTTTRTVRRTRPLFYQTIPTTTVKTRLFADMFALFNCEQLKQCNVIPHTPACGRDWVHGTVAWFENLCTLWKYNCLQLGSFFNQDPAVCEQNIPHHGASHLYNITNYSFDRPKLRPGLSYNPYYTHGKIKD